MDKLYDVIIIGSGVVGNAIAREMSRYNLKIGVLEKELDVCNETSARNSGVLHAGFNNKPGTLMAKFCVEGNQGFDQVADELGVPFKRCGKLVVGFNEEDKQKLIAMKEQGEKNGVKGLEIIGKDKIKEIEPNIDGEFAMWSKNTGILNPFLLTIALAENAATNGAEYYFGNEVIEIKRVDDIYNIKTVKDPVDGDLAYSDKKTEKNGYYIDSGKLNTKKAGTYEVMVFAKDVNGNEAKESFKVVVKKKKVVRPVSEPTNNGVSNSNTSNVSGQSNNNNTNITNNTNKSNESNSTNKAPAKNDTSSSGNKTDKPSGNKKDDGKLCPLGKDPYKPCNAILNYKGGYGVYPTIEAAMDDGERLALDRKSPYWMKGFTAGPLFNNINHVQAYTIFWDMEH